MAWHIFKFFACLFSTIFGAWDNGSPIVGPAVDSERFSLRILHTNDIHARFYETSNVSSRCNVPSDECYGGFARLATLIREARAEPTPVLYLDAGDTFSGLWHWVYKHEAAYHFMNILQPNATSLGNHEFDNGLVNLTKYIENIKFPILAANLNITNQPEFVNSPLQNSTVLTVQGKKIGIVGYVTPESATMAETDKLVFNPEIESIQKEVDKLKEKGVNILIALGHSGYEMDKRIAKHVNGIDLVIGGHTNTFLYTGKQPDMEKIEGVYPFVVKQASGRKVYVVQAYAFTKYLGNLTIHFDSHDEIEEISGNPILVKGTIPQARDVLDELNLWKKEVDNKTGVILGSTKNRLDGDAKSCRKQECNMGNFITDAFVSWYADKQNGTGDTQIAFMCGGCIRASIEKGQISIADIVEVLPYDDPLVTIVINGTILRKVLEHSVANIEPKNPDRSTNGAFLHYSGINVTYNFAEKSGQRIVTAEARSVDKSFKTIENHLLYKVLVPYYTKSGSDGYDMLKNVPAAKMEPPIPTDQVVIAYLQKKKEAIDAKDAEGRITFQNNV